MGCRGTAFSFLVSRVAHSRLSSRATAGKIILESGVSAFLEEEEESAPPPHNNALDLSYYVSSVP